MKSEEEYIEVELNDQEQVEIINDLIALGQYKQIEPLKFVLAMIKLTSTICETEGYGFDNLVSLLGDNADPNLH